MRRSPTIAGALLATATCLTLAACGSSSTSSQSTSSSSSGGGTSAPTINVPGNSNACLQAVSVLSQLSQVSKGFLNLASPGATPSIDSFKQLFASVAAAFDGLDNNAPSQIASSFHVLRMAYDQLNTQLQSATSLQDVGPAFQQFSAPQLQAAAQAVASYYQTTCGITPSP